MHGGSRSTSVTQRVRSWRFEPVALPSFDSLSQVHRLELRERDGLRTSPLGGTHGWSLVEGCAGPDSRIIGPRLFIVCAEYSHWRRVLAVMVLAKSPYASDRDELASDIETRQVQSASSLICAVHAGGGIIGRDRETMRGSQRLPYASPRPVLRLLKFCISCKVEHESA